MFRGRQRWGKDSTNPHNHSTSSSDQFQISRVDSHYLTYVFLLKKLGECSFYKGTAIIPGLGGIAITSLFLHENWTDVMNWRVL